MALSGLGVLPELVASADMLPPRLTCPHSCHFGRIMGGGGGGFCGSGKPFSHHAHHATTGPGSQKH